MQGVSAAGRGRIWNQTRQCGEIQVCGAAYSTTSKASCADRQSVGPKWGLARVGFQHLCGLKTSRSRCCSRNRKLSTVLSTTTAVGVMAAASRSQSQPLTRQPKPAASVSGLQWYRMPSSAGPDVQVPSAEIRLSRKASFWNMCGLKCANLAYQMAACAHGFRHVANFRMF